MANEVEVLLIEDNEADAFLIQRELARFLPNAGHTRVETPQQVADALKRKWDIILCDFNLPEFDALTVLRQIREMELDVPFILVSGLVEEGIAASMMRLGAKDYIMKDNLKRLGPAIIRELQETRVRNELRFANQKETAGEKRIYESAPKRAAKSKPVDLLNIIDTASGNEQDKAEITERHKAVVNILYTAGLIKKHQDKILEQNDLTEQKLNVLMVLSRHHPQSITINTLKDEILNKTSDISRLIERMVSADLIHYTQNRLDKRARNISISVKGQQALERMNTHADIMFLSKEVLSEESARILNEELKKILDAMEA